jgi:hypothetical protein
MIKLWVYVFLGVFLSYSVYAEEAVLNDPLKIEVYRSRTCGCCGKWIEHLKANQFEVIEHVVDDMDEIKQKYAVPGQMASCHTAIVDSYIIEGHVPSDDIKKLLKNKPPVRGISVPGMPVGTPGMEMGSRKDAFQVISFDKDGQYRVFSHYEGHP